MNSEPYVTLDGSWIEELLRPERGGPGTHSVARATVGPGQSTRAHRHERSNEVYFLVQGGAAAKVGDREFRAGPGDAVLIPRGWTHEVRADPGEPCVFLCVCWPPYQHEDTELCG